MAGSGGIIVLGIFVADMTFRGQRLPRMGETLLGESFTLGPGGKGSNQAIAAARAGGKVSFISRLGQDTFAEMALKLWQEAGITPLISQDTQSYTGAASIFVNAQTGDNAITVAPGAAATISREDLNRFSDRIAEASVFMTQLEQPVSAALRGLEIARDNGVTTILNPAPAAELSDGLLALCDVLTPNESEVESLTGLTVTTIADAEQAATKLRARGVGSVAITLGENGVLFQDETHSTHIPAIHTGDVVETTGAGDAFNGGFATALSKGASLLDAVRFGNATAAISVTRRGTAASMPSLKEIQTLLQ